MKRTIRSGAMILAAAGAVAALLAVPATAGEPLGACPSGGGWALISPTSGPYPWGPAAALVDQQGNNDGNDRLHERLGPGRRAGDRQPGSGRLLTRPEETGETGPVAARALDRPDAGTILGLSGREPKRGAVAAGARLRFAWERTHSSNGISGLGRNPIPSPRPGEGRAQ
jgi:hypothetical protein